MLDNLRAPVFFTLINFTRKELFFNKKWMNRGNISKMTLLICYRISSFVKGQFPLYDIRQREKEKS